MCRYSIGRKHKQGKTANRAQSSLFSAPSRDREIARNPLQDKQLSLVLEARQSYAIDIESQQMAGASDGNRSRLLETDAIARSQSQQLSLWAIAPEKARLMMDRREEKGREIAGRANLKPAGELWHVPSQSGGGTYTVDPRPVVPLCTCPDYTKHQVKCKHIHAVEYAIRAKGLNNLAAEPPRAGRRRPTYRQNWTAYNLAQTREKTHFL